MHLVTKLQHLVTNTDRIHRIDNSINTVIDFNIPFFIIDRTSKHIIRKATVDLKNKHDQQ